MQLFVERRKWEEFLPSKGFKISSVEIHANNSWKLYDPVCRSKFFKSFSLDAWKSEKVI